MRIRIKKANKHRPIRVIFKNPCIVSSLIRGKNKLKSCEIYKNISIKCDETAYQRESLLKCREELKRRKDEGEDNLTIKYIKGTPTITTTEEKN